jgi:hypothetical protein
VKTIRITSSYFCAGIIVKDDIIVQAAPILSWSINKRLSNLKSYFNRKGWKYEEINDK